MQTGSLDLTCDALPSFLLLAAAGYQMCPWSDTYPDQFSSAAMQNEELREENAFNKMLGIVGVAAGELLL